MNYEQAHEGFSYALLEEIQHSFQPILEIEAMMLPIKSDMLVYAPANIKVTAGVAPGYQVASTIKNGPSHIIKIKKGVRVHQEGNQVMIERRRRLVVDNVHKDHIELHFE